MRIANLAFTVATSLLIITGGVPAQPGGSKIATGNAASQNTIHLFNGENLDGWYTFIKDRGRDNDPKNVFTVKIGIIHISGEEWGCITTNKEFENYKLVVEYKWGNKKYC